jgi:hypothetical protein
MKVAGDIVAGAHIHERRFYFSADIHHVRTPGVEVAAYRSVGRAWEIALHDDSLSLLLNGRLGNGNGAEEPFGVRMQCPAEDLLALGKLHDLAEIHNGHAVADVSDNADIVSYEEIGKAEFLLQLEEQIQNLGLD